MVVDRTDLFRAIKEIEVPRYRIFVAIFVLAFALSECPRAIASSSCQLIERASLDATLDAGRLVIGVALNGKPAKLLVDTGAPVNILSDDFAKELNLDRYSSPDGTIIDIAGQSINEYGRVRTTQLGNLRAERIQYYISPAWTEHNIDIKGIFSTYFLAAYDVEFDFAHQKMNLFDDTTECGEHVVYWTDEAVIIPFELDNGNHAIFDVLLDGKRVSAMIDTGAAGFTLLAPAARHLFDLQNPTFQTEGAEKVAGLSGKEMAAYKTHFGKLEINGLTFNNIDVQIIPDRMTDRTATKGIRSVYNTQPHHDEPKAEMIIGLKELSKLRLFVSYSQRKIYATAASATLPPASSTAK